MTAEPSAPAARRWPLRVAVALAVVAVAAWQGRVHYAAWQHLKAGRAALADGDAKSAGTHLSQCLDDWPRSAEAHFLAGRAARKCGDAPAALRHLDAAAGFGFDAGEIELERALLLASAGGTDRVEALLARHLEAGHAAGADIGAALAPFYLAQFRLPEAAAVATKWTEADPRSTRAWEVSADVFERLRRREPAAESLRALVRLAPHERRPRAALVRLLLELRQATDEAVGHAEWLARTAPGDPAAAVLLASCREAQGRADEAMNILDDALKGAPKDAPALHLRGKLEMNRGRHADALPFLRRGAEADRSDVQLLYSLFVCLQSVGTPAEAREAEARWKRCETDLGRVRELSIQVSQQPNKPELRREIGELFLRHGRDADGVRWLESALQLDPAHAPTHAALAAHFERTGDAARAAEHRTRARRP